MPASEIQKNLDNHTQMIKELSNTLKILEQLSTAVKNGNLDHKLILERLWLMFWWKDSIQELQTIGKSLPPTPEKTWFIKFCESSHLDKSLITLTSAVPGICTLLQASMLISVWVGLAAILLRIITVLSVEINKCKQQDKAFIKQQIVLLMENLNKEGIKMPQVPDTGAYLFRAAQRLNNNIENSINNNSTLIESKVELLEDKINIIQAQFMSQQEQTQKLLLQILQNQNISSTSAPPNPTTSTPPPTETASSPTPPEPNPNPNSTA